MEYSIAAALQNMTVAEACAIATSVECAPITSADQGRLQLDAESAWELLIAGRAEVLMDRSPWLKTEEIGWALTTEQEIEFAQDTANLEIWPPGHHFEKKTTQRHH
jgi:hypothetical protein